MLIGMAILLSMSTASARTSNQAALELARQYLMAACIISKYPDTSLAREANGWAGVIIENGSLSIEQYGAIAKMAKEHATPSPVNKDGSVMNLQACHELSRSAGISRKLRKVVVVGR